MSEEGLTNTWPLESRKQCQCSCKEINRAGGDSFGITAKIRLPFC